MNKFRNVPALVTLFAGFAIAVFMIIEKFSLLNFLWILVLVMLGFYVAGILLRVILNKAFKDLEQENEKDKNQEDVDGNEDVDKEVNEDTENV